MLKKIKNKMKRRNTEPSMVLAATSGPSLAVAQQDNDDHDSSNTDF